MTGYTDKHEYINKNGVTSVVYLMDCMDAMAQMRDKEFSLACVDPPYGIGVDGAIHIRKPDRPSTWDMVEKYERKDWDNEIPKAEYWELLFRVSKNQIVWGGNFFTEYLKPSKGWVFWDKQFDKTFNFSHGELAWTSFNKQLLKVTKSSKAETNGGKDRMHPTQKPIALYDWIFKNYAQPNDTIFDSHCGSGSSRIAADRANLPYVATELDSDYFYAHCKRFDRYTSQLTIF